MFPNFLVNFAPQLQSTSKISGAIYELQHFYELSKSPQLLQGHCQDLGYFSSTNNICITLPNSYWNWNDPAVFLMPFMSLSPI
jgi:hypothetical protein